MVTTASEVDLESLAAEPDPSCGFRLPDRAVCGLPAVAFARVTVECRCIADLTIAVCPDHERMIRIIVASGVLLPCPRCGQETTRWRLS